MHLPLDNSMLNSIICALGGLMYDIEELAEQLTPNQTALLLGAGASIPSGGPSGASLARALAKRGSIGDPDDYTLAETAGLFEQRYGRRELAEAVRDLLSPLEPTGGLRLLPHFDWYRIYNTNFDRLVEKVYAQAGKKLTVYRNNLDFGRRQEPDAVALYKIHGCITQDEGFGDSTRMLLTDDDYDHYADLRQASFRALGADILTKDFLVIGQSLNDPHLKSLVREALQLQSTAQAAGRVFLLVVERDEGLARLQENRGAHVFFGDMDSLFAALLEKQPTQEGISDEDSETALVPAELLSVTTDVVHAVRLDANPRSMFNGAPATYADLASGFAFNRDAFDRVRRTLAERPIAVILGAGGVGKTTLARQIVLKLGQEIEAAWEHNNSFPLRAEPWMEYEAKLRESGERAVLLIDDCTENLAAIGRIAEHLGNVTDAALRVVMTATTGKWRQRSKSRYVFSHGEAHTLSRLTNGDINELLNLTNSRPEIRALVDSAFLKLPRAEQSRVLRERCSADMFVCMKNIFATEKLDHILLREYADLDDPAQDIYRNVAALEALGAKVHRQLIMRLLGVDAGALAAILNGLTGVVTEFDIRPRDGYYGWETRHKEIAKVIAQYKFAKQEELDDLFVGLIDAINPTVRLEIETARALCTEEFGIDRLTDVGRQVDLLKKVVRLLPGEQVPRHRLIRHLIDQDRLEEAAGELRTAQGILRPNPVLARYDVLILARSADTAMGLMKEDRLAILLDAHGRAVKMVTRYPNDMHCYASLADVALRLADHGAGLEPLEDAVLRFQDAELRTLDPTAAEMRSRFDGELSRRRARVERDDHATIPGR